MQAKNAPRSTRRGRPLAAFALLAGQASGAGLMYQGPLPLQHPVEVAASPTPESVELSAAPPSLGCEMFGELPPTRRCRGKGRRPIIVAGEGKTGTETIATALAMLGLKTAHFGSLL